MTDAERLFECVALKGECPDCARTTLDMVSTYVFCKSCHASFAVTGFHIERAEIDAKFFPKSGDVIPFKAA